MNQEKTKIGLSGNALKLIAAILMVIDHIGYILLPQHMVLRIIGRLSFPIFAYMIAEGCYHTRNKTRYFLGIFFLSILYQFIYYFFERTLYFGILVTFSIAILLIYLWQFLKGNPILSRHWWGKLASVCLFFSAVQLVYLLNCLFYIDYGFWGCMAPVLACVWRRPKYQCHSTIFDKLDRRPVHITMFGLGLAMVSLWSLSIQWYSLLALPLLFTYSGQRGKWKMKWFFYIFYPVHLAILYLIGVWIYF